MNATKDDNGGFGLGGILAQSQGIADKVSDVLNFAELVVMDKDNGISFLLQF